MRVYASSILIKICNKIFFLLWDWFWCLAIILHGIFIYIWLFCEELRLYEIINKIFELERPCRSCNIFIGNLILSFFVVIIAIIMRSSIIFLRNLSFHWSKLLIFLNLFSWLNLSLKIHFVSVYRGGLFWIGEILRLKGRMVDYDRVYFLLNFWYFWWNFIWVNRLSSHLHCFIFLSWLFWISIDVDTVDILLYLFYNIRILIGVFNSIPKIYFTKMIHLGWCFDSCILLF